MTQPNILFSTQKENDEYINEYIKVNEYKVNNYKVFLDKEIGDPSEYRELIDILFSCQENDVIHIYINSTGGNLAAANAIIEGLKFTRADVTGILLGDTHSAASMIALNCHNIIVTDSATMMIHTAYTGNEGIISNMQIYSEFARKNIEKLLHDTYEGFLSPSEIDKVKLGLEIWLDSEEIKKRYESRIKYLEKKEKSQRASKQKE